ncbi:MAG: hypothetical protein MUE52_18635 [Tabrizicola sp.]|jgi:hypothetical protein|nr:hypothetical protein [Tabrizicola sp.]
MWWEPLSEIGTLLAGFGTLLGALALSKKSLGFPTTVEKSLKYNVSGIPFSRMLEAK